jgi:competence protein ComEA
MSTRKIIILCVISFVLGLLAGFAISYFFFPNLWKIETLSSPQSVYEVEHMECPVEEKTTECSIFVDISGAVKNPGVYCFNPSDRVVDAIQKAGGFISTTSLAYVYRNLNLSRELSDSQKIYIPSNSELLCELKEFTLKEEKVVPTSVSNEAMGQATQIDGQQTEEKCININSATITELDSLNGIGLSTAQKIIDNRPYNSIEEILNVNGIGEATYEKFKDNICI